VPAAGEGLPLGPRERSCASDILATAPVTEPGDVWRPIENPPREISPRLNLLLRRTLLVGAGSLATAVCSLVVIRLYADLYGASESSAVLIFRLYGSLLLACGALGMPIALQRTVAYLGLTPSRAGTAAIAGLGIAVGSLGLACAASAAFAGAIAQFLDHPTATELWRAFMLLTYAQAFATMVSFIQLARGRVSESVAVTVGAYGLAPLFCVVVFPSMSLPAVIGWTAVLAAAATALSLVQIFGWAIAHGVHDVRREAQVLLRYGMPRVPASALEPALDLVLPWMAIVSGAGLAGAGYLAIGLALMRPLNPISGALSQVLLPESATAVARQEFEVHATRVRQIAEWALHAGLFMTFQMVVWVDLLIRLWLGPDFAPAAGVAAIVCLSLAPSFLYACLRGLIDGETERAVNTVNLCIAVLVFVAFAGLSGWLRILGVASLGVAYLASRLTLASMTLRYLNRAHGLSLFALKPWRAIASTALLGVAGLVLRELLPERYLLVGMVAFFPFAALLFLVVMTRSAVEWIRSLRRLLWATP